MPRKVLSLESIPLVDHGSVGIAVNQALRKAQLDCLDRPGLKKARKVNLEISLTPNPDSEGEIVEVQFQIKETLPSKATVRPMISNGDGLVFQTQSPENPLQETMEFEEDDTEI